MARKLAAGNWKMNGTEDALAELRLMASSIPNGIEMLICPPATLISRAKAAVVGTDLFIGGQTCHPATSGAHTGDLSAEMLVDAGASHVILGHSERRTDHHEDDAAVANQAMAALAAGMVAVICVGETEEERDADETLAVVARQLAGSIPDDVRPEKLVIAYEPVWAIGTGRTPTLEEIGIVHSAIRAELTKKVGDAADTIPILYGGSVKPNNAEEIFAVQDVDGALVGGASLKAADFNAIATALAAA